MILALPGFNNSESNPTFFIPGCYSIWTNRLIAARESHPEIARDAETSGHRGFLPRLGHLDRRRELRFFVSNSRIDLSLRSTNFLTSKPCRNS